MSASVALMANGEIGAEVARRLVQMGDRVVRLYLHREESQKFADEIIKNSAVEIGLFHCRIPGTKPYL